MAQNLAIFEAYLFSKRINSPAADALISCFSEKLLEAKDFFCRAGFGNTEIGFVAEGLFALYQENEDGSLFVKDFIGEDRLLVGGFQTDSFCLVHIQALTPSIILKASFSDVCKCFSRFPELEKIGREGAEKRLLDLHRRLDGFATTDAASRYRLFQEEFGSVEESIPQFMIASYLGVSPTQLSRIRHGAKSSRQHL